MGKLIIGLRGHCDYWVNCGHFQPSCNADLQGKMLVDAYKDLPHMKDNAMAEWVYTRYLVRARVIPYHSTSPPGSAPTSKRASCFDKRLEKCATIERSRVRIAAKVSPAKFARLHRMRRLSAFRRGKANVHPTTTPTTSSNLPTSNRSVEFRSVPYIGLIELNAESDSLFLVTVMSVARVIWLVWPALCNNA